MRQIALVLILAVLPWSFARAEDGPFAGKWRTLDTSTGTTMVMELFVKREQLHGRVVRVLDANGREINPACDRCAGAPQVRGMIFIRDLRRDGARWIGGRVIDLRPVLTQGFEARCELEIEGGRLRMFGYKWEWAKSWANGVSYWDRETGTASASPVELARP